MKKLGLNADALTVESFATVRAETPRGTVVAHQQQTGCLCGTVDSTCYDTCGGPAWPTNGETCWYASCATCMGQC